LVVTFSTPLSPLVPQTLDSAESLDRMGQPALHGGLDNLLMLHRRKGNQIGVKFAEGSGVGTPIDAPGSAPVDAGDGLSALRGHFPDNQQFHMVAVGRFVDVGFARL